jgi:gliding motility-associated-like protein
MYNQLFKPVFTSGYDPFDYTMLIYNRWGEVLFESHNAEFGWDGTYGADGLVKEGVYTWKIEFKTKASDERKMIVGHVNVLR